MFDNKETLIVNIKRLYDGEELSKDELIEIIECPEELDYLIFTYADKLRAEQVGNSVHLRGLIEFSNICKKNCNYCGIRRDNKNLLRYRMTPEEIVSSAINAENLGYKSIVLQSGEDPYFTVDILENIINKIKSKTDLAITLSIGEFEYNDYKKMKEAGADRYLLRFETSSKELYSNLHPDSIYEERLRCLDDLSSLGFQLGSGFMVGLPGETSEIIADNLLLLKKYNMDMVGIGPFLPHPKTPLKDVNGGTLQQSLKAIALTRLLLRNSHIPATTAMGSLDLQGRQKALTSGANVVMPNVTPMQYRELYQLYPNKICTGDSAEHCRGCITGIINSLGRTVSNEHGHTLKIKNESREK